MKKLPVVVAMVSLACWSVIQAQGNSYSTSFPLTENPISEGGRWINGATVGLDWSNVRTVPGQAFGTNWSQHQYDDSVAVLTGTWSPNQTVTATVHSVNQQSGNVYEEVALRLRTTITAHSVTGYEVGFRCTSDGSQYLGVTRWNGPRGDFSSYPNATGPGIFDGDVVKATIVGSLITVYINDLQVYQVTDSALSSGSPGVGFFLSGAPVSANNDFGFTSFTASDAARAPSAPSSLRITPF
jgi:hypothetical protein